MTIDEFSEKYITYDFCIDMLVTNVSNHYKVLKDLIDRRYGRDADLVGCEIGLRGGITELVLLKTFPKLRMYAIDVNDSEGWLRERENNCTKRIKFIYKRSDDAIFDIEEKLDFVFIDGSKEEEQWGRDFKNYSALVKKGGLVISWQVGQWEKVWGNGGIYYDWPEKVIPKGAQELFKDKEIIYDNGLLWHVNV